VTEPLAPFADVLREPRAEARLRREKLAEAPGLSRGRPAIWNESLPRMRTRCGRSQNRSSLAMPGASAVACRLA